MIVWLSKFDKHAMPNQSVNLTIEITKTILLLKSKYELNKKAFCYMPNNVQEFLKYRYSSLHSSIKQWAMYCTQCSAST